MRVWGSANSIRNSITVIMDDQQEGRACLVCKRSLIANGFHFLNKQPCSCVAELTAHWLRSEAFPLHFDCLQYAKTENGWKNEWWRTQTEGGGPLTGRMRFTHTHSLTSGKLYKVFINYWGIAGFLSVKEKISRQVCTNTFRFSCILTTRAPAKLGKRQVQSLLVEMHTSQISYFVQLWPWNK